jgi:chemotaxis protein CheD
MDKILLQIGEYYVTKKPKLMGTLLGSCVSVCLFNKFNGHAAMNHFLMPSANNKKMENDPGKYGKSSCEMIIQTLMALDSNASHYTAQVFGGANVFNLVDSIGDIGNRNIGIAEQVLAEHKIRIIHREIGGNKGRHIYFNSSKNKVECRKLGGSKDIKLIRIQYDKVFKAIEEIFLKQCK